MIRIEKYLSEQGIMSRREAKKYLIEGLITINGRIPEPGEKFNPLKDTLNYGKKIQHLLSEKITVAVYKPRGIVSSKDTDRGKNIFDIFPQFKDRTCLVLLFICLHSFAFCILRRCSHSN